ELGVRGRRVRTDGLRTKLPQLPVTARLGAVIAEVWADIEQPHRLRPGRHAVLEVRPANRGRPLGPQGEAVATAVLEDVHLLLDDVALVAHGAEEDAGILDDGGGDLAVVEQPCDALRGVADVP